MSGEELVDEGLNMLKRSAGTGKAGDGSTVVTTFEGVPFRGQDVRGIGK